MIVGRVLLSVSATHFAIVWPLGRPRSLGLDVYNRGLSGMVRLHRWQFAWGFASKGHHYCYWADRHLERVHWILGDPS